MATKKKIATKTAAPKKPAAKVTEMEAKDRAEAVRKILLNVEKKLSGGAVKASLGDYIKLIQLSKDMTDESKTELKVGWIEK